MKCYEYAPSPSSGWTVSRSGKGPKCAAGKGAEGRPCTAQLSEHTQRVTGFTPNTGAAKPPRQVRGVWALLPPSSPQTSCPSALHMSYTHNPKNNLVFWKFKKRLNLYCCQSWDTFLRAVNNSSLNPSLNHQFTWCESMLNKSWE